MKKAEYKNGKWYVTITEKIQGQELITYYGIMTPKEFWESEHSDTSCGAVSADRKSQATGAKSEIKLKEEIILYERRQSKSSVPNI